ncbi:uncharacterized protein LOC144798492 [Lissotriton helveticus]
MDFIPYDVFKDLMLDLVGKYRGPPISPTDIANTAPPHPGKPGPSEPHPQSCKPGVPDNKEQVYENASVLKGSGFKEGDYTSVSPAERCKEAVNIKTSPSSLGSSKDAISPGQPTYKSGSVSSSFHSKKDPSSYRNADHGPFVYPTRSKGYSSDSHSLTRVRDYKKDNPSPVHLDSWQAVSPANNKNEAFSSRPESRHHQVSRIEDRASHSSEKKHGSAEILKAEEKSSMQVAATPLSVEDKAVLSKEDIPSQKTQGLRRTKWDIQYPVDARTTASIEKLARFVVELGLGMDTFNAEKLSNNPNFAFLKEGRTAAYELLKMKLFQFQQQIGSSDQTRQQDTKSKELIPESPKPLQKISGSATTAQSDCFAAPMLPPQRKRKAESELPTAATKTIPLEEKIGPKTRDAAITLARFIARMGPEKERFTKTEAANPKFWFLNQKHHPAYEFYQLKLAEFTKAKEGLELSSMKSPVTSKSSTEETSKTSNSEAESSSGQAAENPSSLLLLSEVYDSDEEELRSRGRAPQDGRQKGEKSKLQRDSSNTRHLSTEQDPHVCIRSKRKELRKYLKSGLDLSNESVRAMILSRKIAAVKKKLVRNIAVSKKKQIQRSTVGTQTEPKVLLAQELLPSGKRSIRKQRPPAKGRKMKTLKRAVLLKSRPSLQPQFLDVDDNTKETAENLARFLVEDGKDIEGDFDLTMLSKNPEFWFLNKKRSSAYKFYQMKLKQFRLAHGHNPGNSNNLGKVAPRDSEVQTSKVQDPQPPGYKPLIFLNADPDCDPYCDPDSDPDSDTDCYIIDPQEPASQHSQPIKHDPQDSKNAKHALQPSKPEVSVPQRSKLFEPAPTPFKPKEPALQHSKPEVSVPQRSKPIEPASTPFKPTEPTLQHSKEPANSELMATGYSEKPEKAIIQPSQSEAWNQTSHEKHQHIPSQDSDWGQGKPKWNPNQALDSVYIPRTDASSSPAPNRVQGSHDSVILKEGDTVLTCWIVGDSWVYWAQRYAIRNYFAENLSLTVKWLGFRDFKWRDVLPTLTKYHEQSEHPGVIVLHVGSEDIGYLPAAHIIYVIKKDLEVLRKMFPATRFVFSRIAQRKRWLFSTVDNPKVELARKTVNEAVSAYFSDYNLLSVDHDHNIKHNLSHLYRKDGIHMSDEGTERFLGNILKVLKRFLV